MGTEDKRTAAVAHAIKIINLLMMTFSSIKEKDFCLFPSYLHPHVFIWCSQVSSDLRFTESVLKSFYLLHVMVHLEQSSYTIFKEI